MYTVEEQFFYGGFDEHRVGFLENAVERLTYDITEVREQIFFCVSLSFSSF